MERVRIADAVEGVFSKDTQMRSQRKLEPSHPGCFISVAVVAFVLNIYCEIRVFFELFARDRFTHVSVFSRQPGGLPGRSSGGGEGGTTNNIKNNKRSIHVSVSSRHPCGLPGEAIYQLMLETKQLQVQQT